MEVTKALAALRPLYGKGNIEIVTDDGHRVRGVVRSMKTTQALSAPGPDKLEWIQNSAPQIDLLQAETEICANCPACLPLEAAGEGEAVGCLGRVNYPVDAQFEKFVADRVQLVLDTVDREDQPRL